MAEVRAQLNFDEKFCQSCGNIIKKKAVICPSCGVKVRGASEGRNKIVAGMLSLFLGCFGAHKFYLGKRLQGFLFLAWSILSLVFVYGVLFSLSFAEPTFNEYGVYTSQEPTMLQFILMITGFAMLLGMIAVMFIQFILLIAMSEEKFDEKYNND